MTLAGTSNNRTRGIAALIEGSFGFLWFGWGRATAPTSLLVPLLLGCVVAAGVAVLGGLVAARATGQRTPMAEREIRLRYNVIVGAEVVLIVAGAAVIAALGHPEFTAAWVCMVVGVHFIPMARVFPALGLVACGLALIIVASSALVVGLASSVLPSTVAGPGAGLCLTVAGVVALLGASGAPGHASLRPLATRADS